MEIMRRMAEREKHLELFHDDDDSLSGDGIEDLIIEELSAPIQLSTWMNATLRSLYQVRSTWTYMKKTL
ncbi:hypothetical protein TIFTF001_023277 [Ficus carica]|uniref:Uncharacterized protein n=1 Tax=Ficus carica TaxID=3494 RepID=A0AA88DDJ7_FICCA|nr:hypothetical protein TIFTF001_023277 [Ficus carica]